MVDTDLTIQIGLNEQLGGERVINENKQTTRFLIGADLTLKFT